MKKTIFVLLMGLQCIAPSLAPSAYQRVSDVDFKTVKALGKPSLTSRDHSVLLTPPALAPNSSALLADEQARGAQAKQDHPLKGYTTGSKRIDGLIIASAARNQLDPVLVYSVMHQESAFNPRAVSRKGARGLMQVIPATATRFGVRNIFNPQQNIEAGARYLRFLLDTYEGDVNLALAAYNAGEGNVERYNKQVPPFRETVKYVSEVRQRYEAINHSPLQTAD
jgi:soluble lytic murein transglycosylase-like protein